MNVISLKLQPPLLSRLEEEARNRRRSKSAVIRDCLEQVLWQKKSSRSASCYDLAPQLAGSEQGSPGLATSKARLKRAFRERLRHR
jgi:predicted transcriptional regulator